MLNFSFENTQYFTELQAAGLELWQEGDNGWGGKASFLRPEADYVVWASNIIGIPSVTAKNVDEFVRRCRAVEEAGGPGAICCTFRDGERVSLFDEDVIRKCVGFRSNASPLSKAEFGRCVLRTYC